MTTDAFDALTTRRVPDDWTAIAQPWWRWLGSHGRPVSLEHYGASADCTTLYREFGITSGAATAAAEAALASSNEATPATSSAHAMYPAGAPA